MPMPFDTKWQLRGCHRFEDAADTNSIVPQCHIYMKEWWRCQHYGALNVVQVWVSFDLEPPHVLRLWQCAKEASKIGHWRRLDCIAVWFLLVANGKISCPYLLYLYCICTYGEGFNCLYLNTQVREGRVEDGGRWDDCGAINSALAPNQQVAITINDKVHIVHSCIQFIVGCNV